MRDTMTDIGPALRTSAERAATWSQKDFRDALAALTAGSARAVLDWDEASGEQWARLLVDGIPIAYIHVRLPLAMIGRKDVAARKLGALGLVEVLQYDDAEEPCFSVDLQTFGQAFPGCQWREEAATPTAFSPNDLHWMTAT
jgi:hypothetical protein